MHLKRTGSKTLRLAAVCAVTALSLLLTACGGQGENGESPSPTPSESISATPSETPEPTATVEPTTLDNLDELVVSDDLSVQPEVSAPYPFKVDQTMNKVIVAGSGHAVPSATASVQVQYLGINARTGEVFDASWLRGQPANFSLSELISGFGSGLVGKTVGSRVAMVITSSEAYDPQGQPSIGIEPGDSLIFIVDILDAELAGPSGEPVTPPEGLPVVSEVNGVPQITIPAGLPVPAQVQTQVLIQGSGRPLTAVDAITSHAVCVTWDGTEYYNDYAAAPVSDAASGAVHKGLFNALVGQQTGSRVLVTLPGEIAYPNGNRTPSLEPNTAVACVVDILFTQTY